MSSTAPDDRLLTIEEYADLPDDGWRTELVRGQVVREPQPSYEHGRIQSRLIGILEAHLKALAPHLACVGPFGVITEEMPGTVRGPDLAVVRRDRVVDLHHAGFLRGAPELAIEVVSPSNRAGEIQEKVSEYLDSGATMVWVIYPQTRTVAVHGAGGEARFITGDELLPGGDLLPGLRVRVSELFEDLSVSGR
jgi:Uma2 family endonuclease